MATCPYCKTTSLDVYIGAFKVECPNVGCKFYVKREENTFEFELAKAELSEFYRKRGEKIEEEILSKYRK